MKFTILSQMLAAIGFGHMFGPKHLRSRTHRLCQNPQYDPKPVLDLKYGGSEKHTMELPLFNGNLPRG